MASNISVRILSLRDVQQELSRLEQLYGMTTATFLQNCKDPHGPVSEDDYANWISLVEQGEALIKFNETVHEFYLEGVDKARPCSEDTENKRDSASRLSDLAA